MSVDLARAGLDDLDLLMEWRMRVLHDVFSIPAGTDTAELEQANRAYYENHLAAGTHIACFARESDAEEIVGCGGVCLYQEMPSPDNPSGQCAYLMNIYTAPAWRGHGVGEAVVRWLVDQVERQGITKIYLETSDVGRPLYERLGFGSMDGYLKLDRNISAKADAGR